MVSKYGNVLIPFQSNAFNTCCSLSFPLSISLQIYTYKYIYILSLQSIFLCLESLCKSNCTPLSLFLISLLILYKFIGLLSRSFIILFLCLCQFSREKERKGKKKTRVQRKGNHDRCFWRRKRYSSPSEAENGRVCQGKRLGPFPQPQKPPLGSGMSDK